MRKIVCKYCGERVVQSRQHLDFTHSKVNTSCKHGADPVITPELQFGNLHERMFIVRRLAAQAQIYDIDSKLWHAICDLATEVKGYDPIEPPYGRRTK